MRVPIRSESQPPPSRPAVSVRREMLTMVPMMSRGEAPAHRQEREGDAGHADEAEERLEDGQPGAEKAGPAHQPGAHPPQRQRAPLHRLLRKVSPGQQDEDQPDALWNGHQQEQLVEAPPLADETAHGGTQGEAQPQGRGHLPLRLSLLFRRGPARTRCAGWRG